MQNPQRQANHLQILAPRGCGDIPRLRPHIVDNRPLQPRNQEMRSLVDHPLLHSRQAVEDDCPRTAAHVVQGGVDEHCSRGDGDGEPVDIVEAVSCHDGID